MRKRGSLGLIVAGLALCAWFVSAMPAYAQGVTTGSLAGVVTDDDGAVIGAAGVTAIHLPSGTVYETVTRADGRFSIPGMRVGGPYSVTVFFSDATTATVFEPFTQDEVYVTLGVATDLVFVVRTVALTEEVTVTAQSDPVFSSGRTGAATALSREALAALPTVSQRLSDITRLTPQAGQGGTFAGQDNRLNNITIDGSSFNNSFGLGGQPGDRTGVAPISLDAVEQIQVSVAPFDVRQGNFVGASVNTVTRSGGNLFRGSFYHQFRDDSLVGTEAKGRPFNPGTFKFRNTGGWASGPIVKNRAFFFFNYENEKETRPGTTFRANTGGEPVGGSVTRVLASDLTALSSFLSSRFNYDTGPFQDYDFATPAVRYLAKVDYNLNQRNKISVRYNHLDSDTDVLLSDSSSLGFGNRRTRTTALNFANSNYKILENIRSIIGEWNSVIGDSIANNFIMGYTTQDESRDSVGSFFPMVDILDAGSVYTTFGFEPFTPNNELRYNTFQLQNNFTKFSNRHTYTFGVAAERYRSENVFFPGSQSVYAYNSLADFYTDANDYAANPNRTTSPVTLRRFQVRWANIPGMEKPIQPLEVFYWGAYAQDEWRAADNLKITAGLRFDVPHFGDTAFENANADRLSFRDENGATVQYSTGKLPDAKILWSPRLGFNWDIGGNRTTQVRGGTGVFTGRPAYVWISNQIGNTGVLTGFEQLDNTTARPFNPDPNRYKPANVTGAPATSYELALTDPDFKFPQLWRTNFAVDQRLPWGWTGTVEFLYSRDVNGVYYINANLPAAQSSFAGADNRPRWVGTPCTAAGNVGGCVTRINADPGNIVTSAIVLKNQNEGRSWNIAGTLEKTIRAGFFVKAAYSYGEAKNTVDPGSIAFGSWNNNQHSGNPNNPGLGYSFASPGHRFFMAGTYSKQWLPFGTTGFSFFWESRTIGNTSYVFGGDMNGDGGTSNDLIYIHRDQSEMNFQTFTVGTRTFTSTEQAAAWDAYISQDPYLSKNRGKYAGRGAVFLPLVHRLDFSVTQDLFTNIAGRRHSLQFRTDIQNFTNLLNSDWGVGQRLINNQPLIPQGVDAQGRSLYRLRVINNELMNTSYESTNFLSDVYRVLFSLRYTF